MLWYAGTHSVSLRKSYSAQVEADMIDLMGEAVRRFTRRLLCWFDVLTRLDRDGCAGSHDEDVYLGTDVFHEIEDVSSPVPPNRQCAAVARRRT